MTYNGGNGSADTVTLVFTPDQLAEILANGTQLQTYLADNTPVGLTLNLLTSTWNASVTGFETANVALATGYGAGTFGINSLAIPPPGVDATPDGDDDLVLGTAAVNDILTGLGGDDILVGLAGNDNLNGGANNDLLIGGDGDDILTGSTGNDVLSGGRGFNSFVFADTGAANPDSILDYSYVEGDAINLTALLDLNFGPTSIVADFARLQQTGDDIFVQVDLDGSVGGANFVDVAQLENYGSANQDPVRLFFESSNHLLFI